MVRISAEPARPRAHGARAQLSCGGTGTPSGLLIREDESLVSPLQLGLADDSRWPLAAGHLDSDLDHGAAEFTVTTHVLARLYTYCTELLA